MNKDQRDPRDMTDEETQQWMLDVIAKAGEENGCAGAVGACSMEAFKNPVRRDILNALDEKPLKIDEISKRIGVDGSALKFHFNILQSSNYIVIDDNTVDLTPGGVSFVRSNRRAA